jgi:hypothetical protein
LAIRSLLNRACVYLAKGLGRFDARVVA